MLAIIDGHNNAGSIAIHKKFGFTVAGQLRSVGYKMGDWRDTLIMQRQLGDGDWTLPGDIKIPGLRRNPGKDKLIVLRGLRAAFQHRFRHLRFTLLL